MSPRAVICRKLGAPEDLVLEDIAALALAPGHVRVAIHAAGVNFVDLLMIAGRYQHKPALPFVPGLEAAGEIVEVAGDLGARFAVGDQVMVQLRQGGYAEEAMVAADHAMPLPRGFSFAEGATFRAAYVTAYHALVDRAGLAAGETLLVQGAGGGMGLAAVEIGKLLGATVIAAASSEEKLSVAARRGADHLILYGRERLRDAVKRATQNAGADVVFDPVGGPVFEESLHAIAWGARLLVIGFAGGIAMAPTNLILIKGASVIGVRAGESGRHDPERRARLNAALSAHAAAGRLRPHISHTLPLERWAEAMRLVSERRAIGRVALLTRRS
jgi:NADPH:quinone reductase